jgi:glycosyltransferase involved in cell wall biosynthesis
MGLTVLQVAYPFSAVGPDAVGGAEQIVSHLDRALVHAGHRSVVVACAGSTTSGQLVPTRLAAGPLTDAARGAVQREHRQRIERAIDRYHPDVIHMHGLDFLDYLPRPGVTTLVTLHLPPGWYPREAFRLARPRTHLHCVSPWQRRACPPEAVLLPDIENGVPVDELGFRGVKRRYAVVLGRICAEKNQHVALDAGRRAAMPVLLGGAVYPFAAHQRYFEQQIVPRLDTARRFGGPLGFRRKRRLLASARCLLQPSLAPETSSLVAMEALACGTPVVAFPSGALPDLVERGVTGFLVEDAAQMAEAAEAASTLDPEQCRETARRRFSREVMARKYLATYEQLARGAG